MCCVLQLIPTCPLISVQHCAEYPEAEVELHVKYVRARSRVTSAVGADSTVPSRMVAIVEMRYMFTVYLGR